MDEKKELDQMEIEKIFVACEVDLQELKENAIEVYRFQNYEKVTVNKMLVNRIRKNINSRLLRLTKCL